MTLAITLPDEMNSRLATLFSEDKERDGFVLDAIADALEHRDRESKELIEEIEAIMKDVDENKNLIPFEDFCRQWEEEIAAKSFASIRFNAN